jgi:UDPglucose 6-dehydrogenase
VKIAVIGVGHVGLVTAGVFAELGHTVVGCDHDTAKITSLQQKIVPFYEPELAELIATTVDAGTLTFTTDLAVALEATDVAFVCVGTPSLPGGGADLRYVERVGADVAQAATKDLVLVEKSTVPANTGARLAQVIAREQQTVGPNAPTIHVASNPEFLREGTAVHDTRYPDRVVYGTASSFATDTLRQVYAPLLTRHPVPVVETDVPTAELIKHASNAFLATRLSFINAVAQVCDRVGADVNVVAEGMGLDARIGPAFLQAGIGYGGSCFPKDVDAFIHLARSVGYDFRLLDEVRQINVAQRQIVMDRLTEELWHLADKTVTILGAAFKPGTDDLREAPAMYLVDDLLAAGATVRVYDPVANAHVAQRFPHVAVFDDPIDACVGAHACVIATEWPEIVAMDLVQLEAALDYPIVIDGRNALDPQAVRNAGLHYYGIGRGQKKGAQ